jgi:hypothetical protein
LVARAFSEDTNPILKPNSPTITARRSTTTAFAPGLPCTARGATHRLRAAASRPVREHAASQYGVVRRCAALYRVWWMRTAALCTTTMVVVTWRPQRFDINNCILHPRAERVVSEEPRGAVRCGASTGWRYARAH